MPSPIIVPVFHWTNVSGVSSAGYKLNTYFAGTSNPQATWTDVSLTVQNANPVILDSNGDANVWIDTGIYKFVLTDASNNVIWTADNVSQANLNNSFGSEYSVYTTAAASFLNAQTFTVPGDVRSTFIPKQVVRFNGSIPAVVVLSTFGAGLTTVTISAQYFSVPNPITLLEISNLTPNGGNAQGGVFSLAKRSIVKVSGNGAVNLASNTQYVVGINGGPWVMAAVTGDDFSEWNAAAGSFSPSQVGAYLVTGHVAFNNNGATVTAPGLVNIIQNGAVITQSKCSFAIGTGGTVHQAYFSTLVFATAAQPLLVRLDNGPTIGAGTAQSGLWELNFIQLW